MIKVFLWQVTKIKNSSSGTGSS